MLFFIKKLAFTLKPTLLVDGFALNSPNCPDKSVPKVEVSGSMYWLLLGVHKNKFLPITDNDNDWIGAFPKSF